jgi:hypothetical protein
MGNDWTRPFLNAVNNLQFCHHINDEKNAFFHSDKQITYLAKSNLISRISRR